MILAGVLFLIIGALYAFWPEIPYSLFESWKHKDDSGEPSEHYVFRAKVGGWIGLLIGAVTILTEIF